MRFITMSGVLSDANGPAQAGVMRSNASALNRPLTPPATHRHRRRRDSTGRKGYRELGALIATVRSKRHGLGLSIKRHIVEKHDGQLGVASNLGAGATA